MRCRSRARLGAIWRPSLIESWGAEQQVIQRWVTTSAPVFSCNACIVGNAEVTSINVFLADDAPLGDAEPLSAAITGVMETHLLTNNLIFFTPAERDLLQGLRAECKPGRFDAVPPKGVFEIPECPGAMDGVQKIFANTVGLHRA